MNQHNHNAHNQKIKKETYKISGMHCASCAGTIERVLLKSAGVRSASVNFASETALIEFDENSVTESDLAEAVESEIGRASCRERV